MLSYQEILERSKLDDSNVINAYCYGSRVYGTATKNSDYDFIFVVKKRDNEQFSDNLININFFTDEGHQQRLDEHEISALECQFLSPEFILKETKKYKFNFDVAKLRHSLSRKSSNSWVKCKKKLTVEKDYDLNVGRKSMFHAFRIMDYGFQLATEQKIYNYQSCNPLYHEIMSRYNWDELFDTFKKDYNEWCSRFKSVTHK